MEFFRIRRTIPFMRYSLFFNAASFVTFLVAVGFLTFRGLNLSIEFTGGTVMEVSYRAPAELEKIRAAVDKLGWGDVQVQSFGSPSDVLIRLPAKAGYSSGQQAEIVMTALTAEASPSEAPACGTLHAAYAEFVRRPQAERTAAASSRLLAQQKKLGGH
jgi:preprotein translocase subunit SecF